MTIYEQLQAAGVPLDHHESDLYAKDTPETRRILDAARTLGKCTSATRFRSQIDGAFWWDIPFHYDPFWPKRAQVTM